MNHDPIDQQTNSEQREALLSVLNRIANALENLVAQSFSIIGPGPNDPPPEPPEPPPPPPSGG